MIRTNLLGLCGLFLSLTACGDNQKSYILGGSTYNIPSDYLVMAPAPMNSKNFDNDSGIVAISFDHDKDFLEYLGANSWLPNSSITVMLYSRKGTTLTGVPLPLSEFVDFSIEGKDVVEFENNYRVFSGENNISWQTLPKEKASVGERKIMAQWVADCIPMGGMEGIKQSRKSMDIPTSCSINIEYLGVIINLTTSEDNLVNNIEEIVRLVIYKIDSWVVSY